MTNILSDTKARCLVFACPSVLELADRAVAAKTGTTNDNRDAWTVGYTPDIAAGVWVGNNDNTPMDDVLGSAGAGPIWQAFMTPRARGYRRHAVSQARRHHRARSLRALRHRTDRRLRREGGPKSSHAQPATQGGSGLVPGGRDRRKQRPAGQRVSAVTTSSPSLWSSWTVSTIPQGTGVAGAVGRRSGHRARADGPVHRRRQAACRSRSRRRPPAARSMARPRSTAPWIWLTSTATRSATASAATRRHGSGSVGRTRRWCATGSWASGRYRSSSTPGRVTLRVVAYNKQGARFEARQPVQRDRPDADADAGSHADGHADPDADDHADAGGDRDAHADRHADRPGRPLRRTPTPTSAPTDTPTPTPTPTATPSSGSGRSTASRASSDSSHHS